jgi:phosphoenolpyruvate synthase/pyruvate phosphate dikinase
MPVFASKTDKNHSHRHGSWLTELGPDADSRATDARAVGGKAARTAWLIAQGFDVPRTWVLGTAAFEAAIAHLPPACEPRSLLRAALARTVYNRAAEARAAILASPLPAKLGEELTALWEEVADISPWGLAVRSSATCEDSALVSMAGLADTKLGVRGAAELIAAVREVWASVASGRALSYLAAHGVRDLGMAIVIQPVVVADAAGVMFTRAPDKPKERIVNVAFGLGAPVVDGVASPDVFRFDPAGKITAESIAHKPKRGTPDQTTARSHGSCSPTLRGSRLASRTRRTSRGTSSSPSRRAASSSCRRAPSRAAPAIQRAAVPPPCGAA